ncbi:MAG: aldehyde ferredoxin oxidoreductase family protein [Candidatus Lokiarchaeota archaeon]
MPEQLYGYNGKVVHINLNNSKIEVSDLDPIVAEQYLGGVGLSAKLTYDMLTEEDYHKLKENPLNEINPLIFATGPLTGTSTPSSSRYSVTAISPLTGIWGESTSGGFIPIALRRSGYDAIVIRGASDHPTYLLLDNNQIEIKDATHLWTKTTYETIEYIRNENDNPKIRIACIGKAGENQVSYAAIINDEGRAAGRCGIGTIMGAKKLKAFAVSGSNSIIYKNKDALIKNSKTILGMISTSFGAQFYSHYGTLSGMDIGMIYGDVPGFYFTKNEFPIENLTGLALKEQYPVLSYACAGCTIACGRRTFIDLEARETEINGPEYETTVAFGPILGIFNFDSIIKANYLCNREGLDTISCGVSIAFLIYLVENKIALKEISQFLTDIKMEEIRWGNEYIILKLINKIIERKDIGEVLAKGTKKIAEILSVNSELAAHVKGLEVPFHDPRANLGQALSYMTCCVGANHCKGDFYLVDWGQTSYMKIKRDDPLKIDGREISVINMQDMANIYDSAVICSVPKINEKFMSKLIKASTGFDSLGSVKKLLVAGERATNLKRFISCKLGCSRADDILRDINSTALKTGVTAGINAKLTDNLRKYYEIRKWDWETGWPSEEKLKELNIT